jgi:hypothetical protein
VNAPVRLPVTLRDALRVRPSVRIDAIAGRLRALTDHADKEFLPAALEIRDKPASP